jgi:hypothetical protein
MITAPQIYRISLCMTLSAKIKILIEWRPDVWASLCKILDYISERNLIRCTKGWQFSKLYELEKLTATNELKLLPTRDAAAPTLRQ